MSRPAVPRRSYTAVGNFGLAFFKYAYTLDTQKMVEKGTLTPYLALMDAENFPAGRVVYENGKKLVPPQGNFPPILITGEGNSFPLNSYMVGVFDPQSGLSGFIDPQSVDFAINSTDKPVYLNGNEGTGPSTNIPNSGNPVVTNGNILSLIRPSYNSLPLPQYVGIAAAGTDYLNFAGGMGISGEGIFDAPYALAISQGLQAVGLTGFATGEGGNPNTTNWAGMYNDGNVYYTGNLYVKNSAGIATLSAGTCTLNNVLIGYGNQQTVHLTHNAVSGTIGILYYTLTRNGSSDYGTLVIHSSDIRDNSTVNWFMVNVGVDY